MQQQIGNYNNQINQNYNQNQHPMENYNKMQEYNQQKIPIEQSRTVYGNFVNQPQFQQQNLPQQRYQYQHLDTNSFYRSGSSNFNQTNMAINNSNYYARQPEMI